MAEYPKEDNKTTEKYFQLFLFMYIQNRKRNAHSKLLLAGWIANSREHNSAKETDVLVPHQEPP